MERYKYVNLTLQKLETVCTLFNMVIGTSLPDCKRVYDVSWQSALTGFLAVRWIISRFGKAIVSGTVPRIWMTAAMVLLTHPGLTVRGGAAACHQNLLKKEFNLRSISQD